MRGAAAVGVGEVASHVVHLDAQEVAEPVREEDAAETGGDGFFGRQVDDLLVLQDAREREVRLVVELGPGTAGPHVLAERLLAPSIAAMSERNRSSDAEAA